MRDMNGWWAFERTLREAGEARGWTYLVDLHSWITRTGLRVVLEADPPHVRVAGRHGGVIEFGSALAAIEFIDEAPLPPGAHRPRADVPDRVGA